MKVHQTAWAADSLAVHSYTKILYGMALSMRKLSALLVCAGAIGFGAFLLIHATTYALPETPSAPPNNAFFITATDTPVRISIPTLSVTASVEKSGVVDGNRMQAPRKFADAAWFEYGSVPGRQGEAVIAGHKDNGLGLSGVFKHLDKLSPGDEVDVLMASGKMVAFSVAATSSYPYDAVIPGLFSETGPARLALITCDGSWLNSPSEGMTYTKRLVVTAVMKGS